MRLCWNKGSLMMFSCFLSYKSYHKKGTLDFKQRMVKELSELLLTINHSFSTLMQTIHKQLYDRTKIHIVVIDATAKGFLFPTQKLRLQLRWSSFISFFTPQFSYMIFIYFDNFIRKQLKFLIWKYEESLSRFQLDRLIPVLKHYEHL